MKRILLLTLTILCCCMFTQAQMNHVMAPDNATFTGDAVSDADAWHVSLEIMAPKLTDVDNDTVLRAGERSKLGVNDTELTGYLNQWNNAKQAAIDTYNQKQNGLNASIPAQGALIKIYRDQLDRDMAAASTTFINNLKTTKSGDHSAAFLTYAKKRKSDIYQTTVAPVTTLNTKVNPSSITTTSSSNGYTYYVIDSVDASPAFYQIVGMYGSSSSSNWTCSYDYYHHVWQPAGCTSCGPGIPCHKPKLVASIGTVTNTTYLGSASPSYYFNGQTPTQRDAIPTFPLPKPEPSAPSGDVWCEAAVGFTSTWFPSPAKEGVVVTKMVVTGAFSTGLGCQGNGSRCNPPAFTIPTWVNPIDAVKTADCSGVAYYPVTQLCKKQGDQAWVPANCDNKGNTSMADETTDITSSVSSCSTVPSTIP